LASVLLKDTGIKKRIISHYIPVINKVINSYLQQMNFFVLFELDEEFNEKIRSRHRDEFTYNSFSEGEKRKIDLALLFAWRKIAQMKNSVSTNLLILDEILDGSLDNTSTESFLDIIANLDKTTNLFVISHKPKEIIQDRFEKQITFVKKNNFSQIER
jgi:ABC-type multidrug transport system ATPase subunit